MIKTIRDFVLVKPEPVLTVSKGGIIIPDTVKQSSKKGTVVSVGPSCELPLKSGEQIYYEGGAGQEITYAGEKFIILRPANIWALIEAEV